MPKAKKLSVGQEAALFATEGSVGGPYGAAGGAVIGAADSLTGGHLYTNTHKAPSVPTAPVWRDIDPNAIQRAGVAADRAEYARDDAAWNAMYPDLKRGRDQLIADSSGEMSGTNRKVVDALGSAGLTSEAGRFSGTGGKQQVEEQSRNLGLPIATLGERNRTFFQDLLGANPRRPFGLNGDDVIAIRTANAKQEAINSDALFKSRLNAYNSAQAQSGENLAALGTATSAGFSEALKTYYRTQQQQQNSALNPTWSYGANG